MSLRGVKSTWRGKLLGWSDETICLCRCHVPGVKIKHFIACCRPPKTDEGKLLLEAYYDEILVRVNQNDD